MLVLPNIAYQADLIDASKLNSEESIQSALEELASALKDSNFHLILERALGQHSLLELILSCISSEIPLNQWLLEHFPADANEFPNSLTARIMERLSTFFLMQNTHEMKFSSDSAKFVKRAPNVLHALLALSFLEDSGLPTTPVLDFPTYKPSQRQSKLMKKLSTKNAPHEQTLVEANVDVPRSRADALEMATDIHKELKDMYEQYLVNIRKPEIANNIKKSFIRADQSYPLNTTAQTSHTFRVEPEVSVIDEIPEIHPSPSDAIASASTPLLNLKLFHYYDTPDGFGQWNILLSSRADREIRGYRRTNPATYEIVMRKIICLKRERRDGDTGDVYVPASFPAREEEDEEKDDTLPISGSVPQDNNELHSLITLEKYVALSKDVLDSIQSDRDAAFPFELSRYEKKIVQYPASCYVLGRSGTGKTTTMLYKMLWVEKAYRMHTGGLQHPRQIFVTRSAVLARKVEEHFLTYTSAFRGVASRSRKMQEDEALSNDLINHNTFSPWKESKLSFSKLEDSDFPLFIPLDDLYYLLEADIIWEGKLGLTLGSRFRPISELKGKFISFQRFLGEYWATFSRKVTSALTCINAELGSILGSERTLTNAEGYLSKSQYLESSRAASSSFSQEQRSAIYEVFLSYKELKRQKDDYDISDRSRLIIAAIQNKALKIKKIDYLYVDETQDNLLIDALVLRMICRNPDGLFWAGDTAQTISAGSTFRFNDLKAFMYRVEEERLNHMAKEKAEKQMSKVMPQVFQLATNFRSHAGIVDCAHVVVELIKKFFPHTIDVLKRERGIVEGAKPMFCNDFDADQFKDGGSFSSAMISAERIELGAHQCILVRDEEARQRFIEDVGDIGLIVTLYDSKGLEFNDVVLLNFFEDSLLTLDQWRVVLNELTGVYAPKFDLLKHSAICLELKSLYVAITRARNNLRIIDTSDKSGPMKILWESLGCITEVSFHEAFSNFAVQSSAEDWNHRAKEFFDQEKYALARDSYLRGKNERNAAVANAFYERDRAQRTPIESGRNKGSQRAANFTRAAEAFARCAEEADGVSAGKKYRLFAGECFEEAKLLQRAVEQFRLAEEFTRAAILLRKLGSFDEVKDLLITHEDRIETHTFEILKDVVRLYYVSSRQYSKAHQLFDSPEEEIEYLEDRNLDLAQVDLLISLGRISEAADVHLADGRFEDAVSLLINDKAKEKASLIKASIAILQGLMTYIIFGSDPRSSEAAGRLLALSREIPINVWTEEESHWQEIMMYRFLHVNKIDELYGLAKTFLACKNSSAALLILDHIFTNTSLETELGEADKTAQALSHFNSYVELLRDSALFGDPCESKNQRFFGVIQHDVDTFSFRPRTLFAAFQAQRTGLLLNSLQAGEGVVMLSKSDITSSFRRCLQDRLLRRVVDENRACRIAPAFNPCIRHIALRDCKQGRCPQPHILVNKKWFLDWLRIHLLQIMIYGSINRVEDGNAFRKEQFFWLKRFFEAVNPPHHHLGSIYHLSVAFYEEMRGPLTVVRSWIREITTSLDVNPAPRFLTMAMLTSDFAFNFDRREASLYMFRSSFVQQGGCPAAFLRGPETNNSLLELVVSLQGTHVNSLQLGALFIQHVVENSLKVDVNVFCTFIERICGQYGALFKYRRAHNSFHGIMLPRSWLRKIIAEFETLDAKNKACPIPFPLLGPLETLIRTLHFDTYDQNYLLTGSNYVAIPYHLRSMYIARICRALGLPKVAYNIHDDDFRHQILQIFKRLSSTGAHVSFPLPYRFYISVQSHNDLVRVLRSSLQGSPFEKMMELRDASRSPRLTGSRYLEYKSYDDLVATFAKSGSSAALDDIDVPEPDVITAAASDQQEAVIDDADEGDVPEDEEAGIESNVDTTQEKKADEIEINLSEKFYVEHSAEENDKACLIQRAFRHVQGLKDLQISSGLEGRSYRWFLECQATLKGEKMEKAKKTSSYRLRYLGVLPQLLACIDAICDQLHAAKNEVKKQLNPRRQLNHEMLDELSERLTKLNVSMKAITKLQRSFGLNNPIHQRADIGELRNQVQQVQDALSDRKYPIVISQEVKERLELVFRVTFKKNTAPTEKMPKKPVLNVEDVY
ncbi:hypothetical protein CVT24_003465 [Panaeolus cyanescens]|uniref:UvrD-like helicase ATP-binding domain-containing protein n=1 Tax=Panaeolus cyanescens TaxID=181874 RepID=A0A409Y7L4_9AGAR|nr:hypothetical protein CVT24_003465 [Panaeolus cyanescens]